MTDSTGLPDPGLGPLAAYRAAVLELRLLRARIAARLGSGRGPGQEPEPPRATDGGLAGRHD